MRSKRLIIMFLIATMLVTILVGCGQQNKDSEEDVSNSSSEGSDTNEDKDDGEEDGDEDTELATPSWKTDTSDHTVTWFVSYDWFSDKFDPEVNEFDKWIKEETGTSIEFSSGDMDKFNVLISTDSLPDIITTEAIATQRTMLENKGQVLPLDELLEDYAPELYAPQSQKDWYKAPDGHWYSILNFYYGEDNVEENDGFFETHNQNFVRIDILDEIGRTRDEMRTKEGFLDVLREVKEQEVTYDGVKVIPYMGLFTDKLDERMAEQLGASREDEDGNYRSIVRAPEYLETMLFYNTMYREGLMTDESFTVKKDQIEQKLAAGHVFATSIWNVVSTALGSLYAADPEAAFLYAGAIQGDNHDSVAVSAQNNGGWTATMISAEAERPDRAVQLISFLSQEEAVLNAAWGVDGYDIVDGEVQMHEDREKLQTEDPALYDSKYGGMDWLMDYTFVQGTFPVKDDILGQDVIARTRDDKITIFDDKCFSNVVPESGSEEASILAKISEYKQQAIGKIITASSAEECEKFYNEALEEMESLGLSELEEYQNERFQENKKKLGLDFAHPFNQK